MEAYECAIDMVDGAWETLDLTRSKHGIVRFASGVFVDDSDGFPIIFLDLGCSSAYRSSEITISLDITFTGRDVTVVSFFNLW